MLHSTLYLHSQDVTNLQGCAVTGTQQDASLTRTIKQVSLLPFSSLCRGLASLCTVVASQLSGRKWHAWTLWDFKRFRFNVYVSLFRVYLVFLILSWLHSKNQILIKYFVYSMVLLALDLIARLSAMCSAESFSFWKSPRQEKQTSSEVVIASDFHRQIEND